MNADNKRKTRLQKLSGSDFEIADGQSDIRGWHIKDSSGKRVGEVDELIFDFETRRVRYLVADLSENEYHLEGRDVLVPIGIAELHENDDEVIIPGITTAQLNALPEYDEDRFDTEHEVSVRNVFGGLGGAALNGGSEHDEDFYQHGHFNEENLYRNRKNRRGSDELSGEDENLRQNDSGEINPGGVWLRSRDNSSFDD